jgi:3-oxoacyl-[acyl-carrier protein] reductase
MKGREDLGWRQPFPTGKLAPKGGTPMDPVSQLSRSVAGKIVLVTGAASGMGRATAHVFAREGAKVAVTDVRGEEAAEVAAEIRAEGGEARAWPLDVGDAAAIAATVPLIAEAFGGLDVLINNAGASKATRIDDEAMTRCGSGCCRSCSAPISAPSAPRCLTCASRPARASSTSPPPRPWAPRPPTASIRRPRPASPASPARWRWSCPGPIHTGMTARYADADKATFAKRRTALGRYGDAAEVAHVTLSLCLPAASYITGVTIPVDGGLMARNA